MTEAEFDAAEKALLDRLDAIKERAADGRRKKKRSLSEEVVTRKTGEVMSNEMANRLRFFNDTLRG